MDLHPNLLCKLQLRLKRRHGEAHVLGEHLLQPPGVSSQLDNWPKVMQEMNPHKASN